MALHRFSQQSLFHFPINNETEAMKGNTHLSPLSVKYMHTLLLAFYRFFLNEPVVLERYICSLHEFVMSHFGSSAQALQTQRVDVATEAL